MSNLHLSSKVGHDGIAREPIRKGFGRGLKAAGEANDQVVALCADLTDSTQMSLFKEAFPERFIEVGVAEQNLVTAAAGMTALDKIPFTSSYAAFSPGRNWEQIRTTICLNDRPVKIVGSHAGISVGPDGATHQMLEDIALMRVLPNMVVLVPGDAVEAEKATLAMAENGKPTYIRLAREATPVFTTPATPFEIGKAYVLREGGDVTILATGAMSYEALVAARGLAKDGISAEVVHCPTIKPLDVDTVIASVKKTGRAVSVEEAQAAAGFGGLIAETLSEHAPAPLLRIGMKDEFGESGEPAELLEKFGLNARHIMMSVHEFLDKTKA